MLLDGWWWFCTKSKNVDHPVINLMTQKWDNHWDKLYYSVIETKDSSPSNQRKDVLIWCKTSLIVFQCELRTIGRGWRLKWEQSWSCLFVCWVWGVWGGWRRWPAAAPLSSVVHPRSQFRHQNLNFPIREKVQEECEVLFVVHVVRVLHVAL